MSLNAKPYASIAVVTVIFQSGWAFSSSESSLSAVKTSTEVVEVKRCDTKGCSLIEIPKSLADKVADDFNVAIVDIEDDGVSEVAAIGKNGNKCAYFYRPVGSKLQEYSPTKNRLCDYSVESNYIYSRYKDGAIWVEDVYTRSGGKLLLIAQDRCIGCGEVFRTIYMNSVAIEKKIVSDEPLFSKRQAVSSQVKSAKAKLFTHPEEKSATRMYLVKGDTVELLDYSEKGSGWYLIRFKRRQKQDVVKWVKCSDLAVCDSK